MKRFAFLKAAIVISLLLVVSSCTVPKKMALSCPEPVSQYGTRTAVNNYQKKKSIIAFSTREKKSHKPIIRYTSTVDKSPKAIHIINIAQISTTVSKAQFSDSNGPVSDLYTSTNNSVISVQEKDLLTTKTEDAEYGPDEDVIERVSTITTALSKFNADVLIRPVTYHLSNEHWIHQDQDTIYLKNGDKASGKLLKQTKKKYIFQNSDKVTFYIPASDVEKILLANDFIKDIEGHNSTKKTHPAAIGGIISSLSGLFYPIFIAPVDVRKHYPQPYFAKIPFGKSIHYDRFQSIAILTTFLGGVIGILLSRTGLKRIKNNPEKFKGRRLARYGLFLGILNLFLCVIFFLVAYVGWLQ